ncbi:R8 protein [Gnomoniopsis smithogilvyi]|uniref:R8 protein n=1 Tax=Gnomoniopsis smithogilvyi TaxID=1191159 RepID=A0A9W8YMZ6_9PEZI|nr:R8 protein [Gnomoniopsis smithogilvyi]
MFYSHESHKTISRKVTRKAIEGVNVPQACGTIEKPPGAPIALRLQGSLLYGVSGVYSKHGAYLLEDAEKMWARMRTYFREEGAANKIDPNAGKAKRGQLILIDDPNFVPDFVLPVLDFDDSGELVLPGLDFSQQSKLSSQLSPVDNSSGSPANLPFINLNIRHSSSQGSVNIPPIFEGSTHQLENNNSNMPLFGEEEELPWDAWPLRIDADGNMIEEPELPPNPSQIEDVFGEDNGPAQKFPSSAQLADNEAQIIFHDDDAQLIFGDEQQLQEFPVVNHAQQTVHHSKAVPLPSEEELSSDLGDIPQAQPQRRQRKMKTLAPDSATHVSRSELKLWSSNYMARIEEAQLEPQQVSAAQARKNAYALVFGMGLGDIGALNAIPGVEHNLAQFYAGHNLRDMLMSKLIADVEESVEEEIQEGARGAARRRSASVAFGSEDEQNQDGRRVRLRDGAGEQQTQLPIRSQQDAQVIEDDMMAFGSDPADMMPELGRQNPGSALSDHHRTSNVPWNRHSSVEVGRNAVDGSPLVGRGSILQQSNVKFSDDVAPAFGSDGFAPLQYDGAAHDLSSFTDFGATADISTQEANTSQIVREALDRDGRNFLGFVENVAVQRGEDDKRSASLRWVEFDGLFEDPDKTKAVVAQAFLHVLTLATKGQVKVKQAGLKENEPFGEIHVGITNAVQDEYMNAEEELDGAEGR